MEEFLKKQQAQSPPPASNLPAVSDPLLGWTRAEMHGMLDELLDSGTKYISAIVYDLELLAGAIDLSNRPAANAHKAE